MSEPQVLRPTSVEEVQAAVKAFSRLEIVGADTKRAWRRSATPGVARLETGGLRGVIQLDAADQVVTVRAGTSIAELQAELAHHHQCLPIGDWMPLGTLGGEIATNLPHLLESVTGSWRDWVLGLTLVTAQGEVVKGGSRVVKSVAGYDVHKFMVGSRGTLGVIVDVTLRTSPIAAVPKPSLDGYGSLATVNLIHRVRPTDIRSAVSHYPDSRWDPLNGTIWATVPEDWTFQRYADDWMLRSGAGDRNVLIEDPVVARLMAKTKAIFDPEGRLEPSAFAFKGGAA